MSAKAFKDATIVVLNAAVAGTPFNDDNVVVEMFNGTGRVIVTQPFNGQVAVPGATVTAILDDLQTSVGESSGKGPPPSGFTGTVVAPVEFLDVRVLTNQ